MKKTILLLAISSFGSALYAQVSDTTTRNTGIPNFGRTIMLADSLSQKRINDSLKNRFVTLAGNETITGLKNFTSTPITGSGAVVTVNSNFIANSNGNQMYSLDVWAPSVSNPGGYTGLSPMAARFRSSVIVGGTLDALYLRSNEIIRGGESAFYFTKSSTANVNNQLIFRANSSIMAGNALINGTYFIDSVTCNSNTHAQGYSQVRMAPVITQTGYTGITRGLYVAPTLTDVANFRAIETNVPWGNSYQIYAGGAARNYFRGATTVDSNWVFSSNVYLNGHTFGKMLRSNLFAYNEAKAMEIQKYANPSTLTVTGDVFRIYSWGKNNIVNTNWNGVGIYDSLLFTQNVTTARISALRLSPVVIQTGFTGAVRGLLIDPVLTDATDFRAIQTEVEAGKGFQMYAAGTAPSYFGGNVGIGTSITGDYKLAVEGTIGARRVKVQTAGWADYVFDSAYNLMPLHEIEKFIHQNKHLPEVPDAVTVAKQGVDVGDNQVLLLKKIEELTLYIIEQNKKHEALTRKVEEQEQQIKKLLHPHL